MLLDAFKPERVILVAATLSMALLLHALAWPAAAQTPGRCVGDCDGSGEVTVDELILGVNIALGKQPLSSCPVFDRNGDGEITVDELVAGVLSALYGCPATPSPSPTFTPRPTVVASATRTLTPSATSSSTATPTATATPTFGGLMLDPRAVSVAPGDQVTLMVTLSQPAAHATTLDVTVADAAVATAAPPMLTIPLGATSTSLTIRGVSVGTTTLLVSGEPGRNAASVFVGTFRGTLTAAAPAVSVEVKEAVPPRGISAALVCVAVDEAIPARSIVAPSVAVGIPDQAPAVGVFAPPVSLESR
jgi:hypothetical protein